VVVDEAMVESPGAVALVLEGVASVVAVGADAATDGGEAAPDSVSGEGVVQLASNVISAANLHHVRISVLHATQSARRVHEASAECHIGNVGAIWVPDSFEVRFAVLERRVAALGDAQAPKAEVFEGVPLGIWVQTWRYGYRRGSLNTDRATRLEALPGWRWATR